MTTRERGLNFVGWVAPFALVVSLLLFIAPTSQAEEAYFLGPARMQASAKLPPTFVNILELQGSRLSTEVNGLEVPVCEIFWAKTVEALDEPKAGPLLYSKLKPGALLGVIHFLVTEEYVKDFHYQRLRPGYYTMRYAVLAGGGGQAQQQGDVVMLSPVSQDDGRERVLSVDELIRHSRLASRNQEPMVMDLVEVDTSHRNFPDVITDDTGACVMQVKLQVRSKKTDPPQELPLAVVIVSAPPEAPGS
jgi:hypothetical protein